jgi:hypothetical protein
VPRILARRRAVPAAIVAVALALPCLSAGSARAGTYDITDSTTLGRSTPSAEMGTQATWQPDWGWGELNLDSAYRERLNFAADGVGPHDVRFYRATVNPGDRATLVWNRRVAGAPDQTAAPQAMTLSNLDLRQYDAGPSQTELSSSQSTIDNVEQVRGIGTAAGTVVYKVKDESSTIDGATEEPFALAAKNPLTPLASPKPVVTLTLDRPAARQGDEVTVTETVHNPSADIAGSNAGAELNVPAGVTVTSGGSTTWSPGGGSLATDATATHEWTVQGTADGVAHLTATAQDDAYGETFESQANTTLRVDSTPPAPAISCPHPVGTDPQIAASWDATDSSTVTGFDIDVSTDGGPYGSWLAGTGLTSATYGGLPGHYYELRLRAADDLGNISGYVSCGPVVIGFAAVPPPGTPLPPAANALPASPHLKLTSARLRRGRLLVEGRLASAATGRLSWSYIVHGHRAVRGRVPIRHGRFHLRARPPRGIAHTRGILRIEYPGDPSFAPQHISRRIK